MTRQDSFAIGQLVSDTSSALHIFANYRITDRRDQQDLEAIAEQLVEGFKEIVKQSP